MTPLEEMRRELREKFERLKRLLGRQLQILTLWILKKKP